MKVKKTIHIHFCKYSWEDVGDYEVFSFKADDNSARTYVCEQEIELEVPNDYDPRAQQIAALEKNKQEVMAEYQKTLTAINYEISKLQALEYTNE